MSAVSCWTSRSRIGSDLMSPLRSKTLRFLQFLAAALPPRGGSRRRFSSTDHLCAAARDRILRQVGDAEPTLMFAQRVLLLFKIIVDVSASLR